VNMKKDICVGHWKLKVFLDDSKPRYRRILMGVT